MIKTFDQIKLKHVAKMETTGKVRQLLIWWYVFPIMFIKAKLIKFVPTIYEEITDGKNNDNSFMPLEKMQWKVKSALKIQEIEICYKVLILHLDLLIRIDSLLDKVRLTRAQRRKINKTDLSLLTLAIEKIKILINIEIEEKGDNRVSEYIEKVNRSLIWHKDKFNEQFNESVEDAKKQEKITILDYAGIFALYVNEPFNGIGNMTITEFKALKYSANQKQKSEQKRIEDAKNNKQSIV